MSYNYNTAYEGCGTDYDSRKRANLAIASVPMQEWTMIYSCEKALAAGTMFAELNLPFSGGRCK